MHVQSGKKQRRQKRTQKITVVLQVQGNQRFTNEGTKTQNCPYTGKTQQSTTTANTKKLSRLKILNKNLKPMVTKYTSAE